MTQKPEDHQEHKGSLISHSSLLKLLIHWALAWLTVGVYLEKSILFCALPWLSVVVVYILNSFFVLYICLVLFIFPQWCVNWEFVNYQMPTLKV
jgi:hypothetical protein